ncbi:MAG: hypothetical protein ACT4OF_03510 [Caulobacteraceae bacterium]
MSRLIAGVDLAAAALVVALSFVHTFAFGGILAGPVTTDEVWFSGAGAAMFLTGSMNLVRRTAGAPRALAILCAVAALLMTALVSCFAAAIGSFGAWQIVVQLILYVLLFVFSLAQALRPAR